MLLGLIAWGFLLLFTCGNLYMLPTKQNNGKFLLHYSMYETHWDCYSAHTHIGHTLRDIHFIVSCSMIIVTGDCSVLLWD